MGPDRQILSAHKSVLTKIDYFAKCLSDDRFVEGRSGKIELPEDNVDAWGDILHYLYIDKLESRSWDDTAAAAFQERCIATWILADKYCIEELCNASIDRLFYDYGANEIKVTDIVSLIDKGLGSSNLARVLIDRLAVEIRQVGWIRYIETRDPALHEDLQKHPACALELLQVIGMQDFKIPSFGSVNASARCRYHIHVQTHPCDMEW